MENKPKLTKEEIEKSKKIEHFQHKTEKEQIKKKKKNKVWEKYEQSLFSEDKFYYNEKEIELIKELLINPIPDKDRVEFWMIASGAKLEMYFNPFYYKSLLYNIEKLSNFHYIQLVDLDLHRTFPENPFFKDEQNLQKLRNILLAFCVRNSVSIGYSQGVNFIAAKLLQFTGDEEKSFWIFTNIIENYLPFDFYLKFTGIRTDTLILKEIINKNFEYVKKNEGMMLCLDNLINKSLISLYSDIVNDELLKAIWDKFFIFGNMILFKTFGYIIYALCDSKFEKYSIEKIHKYLLEKLKDLEKTDILNYFLLMDQKIYKIDDRFIINERMEKSKQIYEENSKYKENFDNKGLKCDKNMPYCLSNYEIDEVQKFNSYKIYRRKDKVKIINDYFFNKQNKIEINKDIYDNIISLDKLVIERQEHNCE